MKRKLFCLFLFLSFPFIVNAKTDEYIDEEGYKLVSSNEKYYKTINTISDLSTYSNEDNIILSYTVEISKEEYEQASNHEEMSTYGSSNVVQTEYKKLTVSILENGTRYKYTAVLDWKKMPAVRSYDIIGIGYYQSVKAINYTYETYYCLNNGSCSRDTANSPTISSTGVGTVFKLPSSTSLKTLKNSLTVYVDKNVNDATIIEQKAVADYSHATKSISLSNANNYSINTNGIILKGISSYYDNMPIVSTTISCNW